MVRLRTTEFRGKVNQPAEPAGVRVRIISAREATRREREQYQNEPR